MIDSKPDDLSMTATMKIPPACYSRPNLSDYSATAPSVSSQRLKRGEELDFQCFFDEGRRAKRADQRSETDYAGSFTSMSLIH